MSSRAPGWRHSKSEEFSIKKQCQAGFISHLIKFHSRINHNKSEFLMCYLYCALPFVERSASCIQKEAFLYMIGGLILYNRIGGISVYDRRP